MNGVAIYMEGGGDSVAGKRALPQGMDALLEPIKAAARDKAWHWKLVPCGGRDKAFRAFRNAVSASEYAVVALLVDSEDAVDSRSPARHLVQRDHWDLAFAQEESVHMMVQVMETWILADQDALRAYYGTRLNASALPVQRNLEEVAKKETFCARWRGRLRQQARANMEKSGMPARFSPVLIRMSSSNGVRTSSACGTGSRAGCKRDGAGRTAPSTTSPTRMTLVT